MSGAASEALRLIEALIFASSEPVSERAMLDLLRTRGLLAGPAQPEGGQVRAGADLVELASVQQATDALRGMLDELCRLYEGRGVRPFAVAGGWQFRTAADLAPHLTRVMHRPRRLPRSAMETLSIIAYHQPCTRAEIEEIRGVAVNQATIDTLLEASLIEPRGRKEVPGRPVLWATSKGFLLQFGLRDLRDLPRREELFVEPPDAVAAAAAQEIGEVPAP